MNGICALAFGPEERVPSAANLTHLKYILRQDPTFGTVTACLRQLPDTWQAIVYQDRQLQSTAGERRAAALPCLLLDDEEYEDDMVANQVIMPMTVLIHLVQYRQFLQQNSSSSHASLMRSIAAGGVQGFCAGLFSAFAVCSMGTEDDFDACAIYSIKLAMCVGAYVDLAMGLENLDMASAILRWSTTAGHNSVGEFVARYQSAYISAISDEDSVTVTATRSELTAICESLGSMGISGKTLAITGSFHHSKNSDVLQRILSLLKTPPLARSERLSHPLLRSNSTGDLFGEKNIINSILEDILCNVSDWRLTMARTSDTLRAVGGGGASIQTFGLVEFIPSFIKNEFRIVPQRLTPIISGHSELSRSSSTLQYNDNAIAVVGMACRFPGAEDLDEFWELLQSGRSMHERIPADRFSTTGLRRSSDGAPFWGNFLKNIDAFDHQFFKKSSREAASMDPQQRLLLQCAYVAMENAGYFGMSIHPNVRDTGVYLGACSSDYNDNVASHKPTAYSSLGTLRAFLTGRISHYFDWTGPSVVYDTACSSSAVAIDAACKAILAGDCKQALAGGVSLYTSPNFYQNLDAASFLSQSGPCKPFDSSADGYCRGEGVGLVVLKKLSDAISCGDKIVSVIASTGVNQNRNCTGITVPHGGSQAELYQKVVTRSGLDATQVSYVEAHGTGTPVGDPIEFTSIKTVFANPSANREEPLHIASVKGSIGHLEGAAGVACINNYGAAGSNAAMIVCQPPESVSTAQPKLVSRSISYPILISGDGIDAVEANCQAIVKYSRHLQQKRTPSLLASLAYGLAMSQNRKLSHSMVTTISDHGNIETTLTNGSATVAQTHSKQKQPVVLCFGGQVGSFVGLDQQLFESSALLQSHLRQCDSKMRALGYPGVFPAIFESEPVKDPVQLHGILFAMQYSSAKSWLDCGLQVDAVIGHSFGQLTALTVSGALSLEDGLKLVCGRAHLIQTRWGPVTGAMVTIEAPLSRVHDLLSKISLAGHNAEIACYNAPESHVLVGTLAAIDALEAILMETGIKHKRLPVTHGFHSAFTEPLLPHLRELAQGLQFHLPHISIETCTEQNSWTRGTPDLVVQHTRDPVYFIHAIERLSARLGPCTWLEASTGSSTPAMIKRCLPRSCTDSFIHASLRSGNASASLAEATATLWRCNQPVQFWPFHTSERGRYAPLNLPGYQFRQTKHWLEWEDSIASPTAPEKEQPTADPEQHELIAFSSFQNTAKSVATFSVDPESEEYKLMVQGHAVVTQPLVPAPLYCELAIRAVNLLSPESASITPEIRSLQIHAPLGLKPNRTIYLVIQKSSIPGQWDFTVKSTLPTDDDSTHASGLLALGEKFPSAEQELASYQRLVGHHMMDSLMTDPDCDALRGSATYRAFARAVTYSSYYRGVQAVYSRKDEACGKIELPSGERQMAQENGILTPLLIDNFIQIAGLQINVLGDCEDHIVFVCTETQRIIYGSGLHQHPAARYEVYSKISHNGPKEVISDIVVFDPISHNVEFVVLGARFTRVTISGLRKALQVANGNSQDHEHFEKPLNRISPQQTSEILAPLREVPKAAGRGELAYKDNVKSDTLKVDYLLQVKALLNKVSDVPIEAIQEESTLDDLGIDSLMVMEVQTEVHSEFQLTIPNKDWATLETPDKLAKYLEKTIEGSIQIGIPPTVHAAPSSLPSGAEQSSDESRHDSTDDSGSGDGDIDIGTAATTPGIFADSDSSSLTTKSLQSLNAVNRIAQATFSNIRTKYDVFAAEEGFDGFWRDVYPMQRSLTLAFVVDAFATIGCDLRTMSAGQILPKTDYLPQHDSLVKQLYVILEDSRLVAAKDGIYRRTGESVDTTPAADILEAILKQFPQHAEEHRLLAVTGSRLGDCLLGRADPLRLLFMDRSNKDLLESVYANGPMYKAMSRLLGAYVLDTVTQWQGRRPLRILEIGGGTGGTTKHIVKLLQQQGIEFKYCFSDLSRGLVTNAKKKFSMYPQMEFTVLDIETANFNESLGQFDLILSTNCIHATRNLQQTTSNMRQLLSSEGFICLVEFTRNIFWFDLVFGLLDGWWLYEDGRTHVLADEKFWNKSLRAAGYGDVQWTEGDSEESRTLRLIAAFNVKGEDAAHGGKAERIVPGRKERTTATTIRWKQEGALDLMADVYMPSGQDVSSVSRPVALILHGGGHVLHTRKHINPRHVKMLLDQGFLPVSVDYRLCPEINIRDGPMTDACEAVEWARNVLPCLPLCSNGLRIDSEHVVVIGYSTGGHLAQTTAFTTHARGLKPPSAILGFYCPSNYSADLWRSPCYPQLAQQSSSEAFDLLEGIGEHAIAGYTPTVNSNVAALIMSLDDPRWRFVLHANWRAQTLPMLINGLPSKSQMSRSGRNLDSVLNMEIPDSEAVASISPYDQIRRGYYRTPTYLLHGTKDDLIPWQQSRATMEALAEQGVSARAEVIEGAEHCFDVWSDKFDTEVERSISWLSDQCRNA
ncbi:hypothetical protein T440DRAFT_537648 [Plenodomus tracheiphilus IPT5]|uniref:Uncharacterized protein n=1 Tax=Plenodomus tracheiphilus IPT5 TaxID=1408161 RepID=A0A6A7AZL2_9PLEO|nr:hypothetical protein T440DRAFT_537648 [Plenodomus tracheiphilus IPT5]